MTSQKKNIKKTTAAKKKIPKGKTATVAKAKRSYLSQTDVPGCSLDQALRVPRALVEHYANGPASPLKVAAALDMAPTAGPFRQLCGASIAYGLTEGGYNAKEITLLPLGRRILRPLEEGDDLNGKREAILKPRVLGEFLKKYDSSPLPRHDIAMNVLAEMGVPSNKAKSVYSLITESAESVGFLQDIKDKQYVDLQGALELKQTEEAIDEGDQTKGIPDINSGTSDDKKPPIPDIHAHGASGEASRRVFITHGKNKTFIDPLKKLLGFGELTPIISEERQSVSKPVPDKVLEDMRSCGAAIIHVDAEKSLIDKDANEHTIINPNVLIEIGAAMALYGRRFILLVRQGVELPSNLQGLYEVRYDGDSLDGEATIKLLEAINDIKNHPLPDRYKLDK